MYIAAICPSKFRDWEYPSDAPQFNYILSSIETNADGSLKKINKLGTNLYYLADFVSRNGDKYNSGSTSYPNWNNFKMCFFRDIPSNHPAALDFMGIQSPQPTDKTLFASFHSMRVLKGGGSDWNASQQIVSGTIDVVVSNVYIGLDQLGRFACFIVDPENGNGIFEDLGPLGKWSKTMEDWVKVFDGSPSGGGGGGAGGDVSKPGGGGGSFDNSSDPITFPSGSVEGVVGSGMIGIFAPNRSQLQEFSGFLWSNNIFDQIKKYNDPLEMIISLTQIPAAPPTAGNATIKIGNILLSENFTMPYVKDQFFSVDLGTIDIKEYWGNFLDYSPYTEIQIFLPYIGFRSISTDDIMGGKIHLKYTIDCLSGGCAALLSVDRGDTSSILYQWSGNCSMQIPLSGRRTQIDFSQLFSVLGSAAAGGAIGGAPAAAAGAINSLALSASKPILSRSGSISGNSGFASVQNPYIVISRKIQSLPDQYQTFNGYPSNISSKLSDLKGFTKISKIHLDGISATEGEKEEIIQILQEGVLI